MLYSQLRSQVSAATNSESVLQEKLDWHKAQGETFRSLMDIGRVELTFRAVLELQQLNKELEKIGRAHV